MGDIFADRAAKLSGGSSPPPNTTATNTDGGDVFAKRAAVLGSEAADLPAYGDNAAWAAKAGQNQNPGFFDKGGTIDRAIQGTGLSNLPHDLSESASRFMDNPTPGNIPIIGPSIDSATRLLTGRSANPLRDIPMSVPGVGPMAVQVGDSLAAGKYPEAFGGAATLLAPGLRGEPSPGLNLAEGDTLTPGFGSRAASGMKAAAPQVGKGLAKIGAGATAFEAIPGEAGRFIVGYPLVRSGMHDVGRGVSAGMEQFRGPVQGPEVAPKGFKSPYPTLPYEPPLPPIGPRQTITLPSGKAAPVMPFEGHDFTPPQFERPEPIGQPGAVLPSGSVVGPASPSRVNPPAPRGNGPRVPLWQQMPISGERPLPTQDFAPTYPSSPILKSGHVIGPRPSFTGEPSSPGVVVNGPVRASGPATGTNQIANPSQLTTMQSPPLASSKESVVFSNSSPHAGPYGMRATLGTQAEMMRQNRLARGLDVPPSEPLPSSVADTPATARARANTSRAKFDENGKRNQLKSK